MKDIVVIGGPNGAGKTTSAFALLPKSLPISEFVNADEIARGLSPFDPEGVAVSAARIMIERIDELVEAGESFAFETTCASRRHVRLLHRVRNLGNRVALFFLWLSSPEAAVARVARRVREGGHGIPTEVINRRYWVGLRNMRDLYLALADAAVIVDNSDDGGVRIAERESDGQFVVHDAVRWALIEQATR